MTGFDLQQVRDVLADTFDDQSFDELLLFKFNINRAKIVKDDAFNTVVLNVLKKATMEGWVALLIAKAAEERPHRPDVQELATRYAATLVAQFKSTQLVGNPETRRAYRELNLAMQGFPTEQELPGLQKIIDPTNTFLNMADWVARLARVEGRVCRIEINNAPKGTGFLVGPDAVLTNHHVLKTVIANPQLLPQTKVRFDYKQLRNGTILSGTLFDVSEILDFTPCTDGETAGNPEPTDPTEEYLDYALVRVSSSPGDQPINPPGAVAPGPKRGWVHLREGPPVEGNPFVLDAPVLIVQHPAGEPLRLAISWQSILEINAAQTRLKHRTNTAGGSSGSPCFDRFLNPIALHHYGDPMYPTARFNQAVPLLTIRSRLVRQNHANSLGGECD